MSGTIPLNRLLKRSEISPLLASFAALMPQVELALLKADGNLFAHTTHWNKADFVAITPHLDLAVDSPDSQQIDGFRWQPLRVKQKLVGLLVGQGAVSPAVFHCLHQSLTFLLIEAQEKRDVANEALERYREINLLYQIAETIGSNLDPHKIPELVLTEAARVIKCDVGVVMLPGKNHQAELEIKASFGYDDFPKLFNEAAQYLIKRVYETGQPDIFTALSGNSSPIDVMLCVPLKTRAQTVGVILLGRFVEKSVFTASDEKLLMALASQTAIALDTAWLHQREIKRQRLDKELAVGQQIQLSLLPEACPTIPGWEFAAIYQSARQVGGDFYDFFELPGESSRLGMIIADVTGKGVPAALFMAFSRSIIRTTSISGENPATILKQANRLIVQDNRSGIYLTAFYAILDLEAGHLAYASAGHNWPLYIPAAADECRELAAGGFLLGALPDINLEEQTLTLNQGDVLVFFTDGVPEAMNRHNEMFGEERLQQVALANSAGRAEDILEAIVDTVKQFTGNTPQSDDFTLFVVKRQ